MQGTAGHEWGYVGAFSCSCGAPERLGVPNLHLILHGLEFAGKSGVLRHP